MMGQIQFHICVQILGNYNSERIIKIDPHLTKLDYTTKQQEGWLSPTERASVG